MGERLRFLLSSRRFWRELGVVVLMGIILDGIDADFVTYILALAVIFSMDRIEEPSK